MDQEKRARLQLTSAMFIFGTIGLFVRHIPMPSSIIAMVRGIIGVAFLMGVITVKRERLSPTAIRKNLFWLVVSGGVLGFNWIALFEAYRYTSVAVGTLCNYMAPILVILASPLVLKEKLTRRKLVCVFVALGGMVCISGVLETGITSASELKGVLLGLLSAVMYAAVVLMNKQIKGIPAYDKTVVQLGASALLLLPYCLLTVKAEDMTFSLVGCGLLLFVGVVHTGVTYYLYFGSLEHISAQSVAVISYIDPVVSVLASVFILREVMSLVEVVGAVLILGATLFSELGSKEVEA